MNLNLDLLGAGDRFHFPCMAFSSSLSISSKDRRLDVSER